MRTATKVERSNIDQVFEAARELHFAFSATKAFKDHPPCVLLFQLAMFSQPSSITLKTQDDTHLLTEATASYDDIGRAVYKKGQIGGLRPYVALHCENFEMGGKFTLMLYGWEWKDADVFLLALSKKLKARPPFIRFNVADTAMKERLTPELRLLVA